MKMIYSKLRRAFPSPPRKAFRSLLKRAIELCDIELAEKQVVSIVFVGPRLIQQINKDYVNHEGITDVISFDYFNYDDAPQEEGIAIEIFICLDKALQEGQQRQDSSYADEVTLYLVHGLLHAAGEDDLDDISRKQMRKREAEVISQLKQEFTFSDIFPQP